MSRSIEIVMQIQTENRKRTVQWMQRYLGTRVPGFCILGLQSPRCHSSIIAMLLPHLEIISTRSILGTYPTLLLPSSFMLPLSPVREDKQFKAQCTHLWYHHPFRIRRPGMQTRLPRRWVHLLIFHLLDHRCCMSSRDPLPQSRCGGSFIGRRRTGSCIGSGGGAILCCRNGGGVVGF